MRVILVQVLRSAFNAVAGIITFLLIPIGCSDIPRDNPLDPKNPDSIRPRIVALDAFVNTSNAYSFNEYILEALDQMKGKYASQITIAEYHRTVSGNEDSLHLVENEFLYDTYIEAYAPGSKGVPDVFFNGISSRIQGASSVASAVLRLEETLQSLLLQNGFFTIEPEVEKSGSYLNLSVKLARLGPDPAENILLKVILTERMDDLLLKRVVRKIIKSDIVPSLAAGEVKTLDFERIDILPESRYVLIFNVTSENELTIYQSYEVGSF
jgi:hypothetical protein